jgi:PUA domain protein
MSSIQLRYKDIEPLLAAYTLSLSKKDHLALRNDKVLFINHESAFFSYENKLVPTLHFLLKNSLLKKIVIDMGAVKYVVSGADIMRPGVVEIESEIMSGDFVLIIDVNNKKPLAVGVALFGSAEMREMKTGKVVKNIHYVGDDVWKG